jgi:predicted nucleotidyltransferase
LILKQALPIRKRQYTVKRQKVWPVCSSFHYTHFGHIITQNGFWGADVMPEVATLNRTGLADALFSSTRQKVLRLFFTESEKDFSIKELIEQADAGSGAVQREVARLVDSGLLQVNLQGRQKRYKANTDSPIYPELSSLASKLLGPEQQVEDALKPINDRIDLALIYGSVAKRTDHADSDIDLMLVSDTLTLEEVFEALEPAENNLSRIINPTLYKREEFKKRRANKNPFLRKVLEGQYIVLKGSVNE